MSLRQPTGPRTVQVAYLCDGAVAHDEIDAPDGIVNAKVYPRDPWTRQCRGYVKTTDAVHLYADVQRIRITAAAADAPSGPLSSPVSAQQPPPGRTGPPEGAQTISGGRE